jgi:hypothetical protein
VYDYGKNDHLEKKEIEEQYKLFFVREAITSCGENGHR